MKKELTLSSALGNIFWGYLLIYTNINLGRLDILPDWLGYLLIVETLPLLAKTEPSAMLLQSLGKGLALWAGISWVLTILGVAMDGQVWNILAIIAAIADLYFHFQFLTDLAAAAREAELSLGKQLLFLRNLRTVIITIASLPVHWENWYGVAIALGAFVGLVHLALCLDLRSMRKEMEAREKPEAPE